MELIELREFLDQKAGLFNSPSFIESDPVSIPRLFTDQRDIEIAGFLSATIAWGNRKSILSSARRLVRMMDDDPYDFIIHSTEKDLAPFRKFVHRTFNGEDCIFFLRALQRIYSGYPGMEELFLDINDSGTAHAIHRFRSEFFALPHPKRTEKHVPDPVKGSSAKRLNMFLRWMVRTDGGGVDFGLWMRISPSNLVCPLDVHTGTVARKLGLLTRRANDWKAAVELTENLKRFDPDDPVKYDFALFGLGVFEKF